jgi:hypothetical protein
MEFTMRFKTSTALGFALSCFFVQSSLADTTDANSALHGNINGNAKATAAPVAGAATAPSSTTSAPITPSIDNPAGTTIDGVYIPPLSKPGSTGMTPDPLLDTGNAPNTFSYSEPVLKGGTQVNALPATVVPLKTVPVQNYRGPHMAFFEVHLKNSSDQVAIIDGDNSHAAADKGAIRAAAAGVVTDSSSKNTTPKQEAAIAAVSAGSLGLAGPIFYEMMTPSEHAKRYLGRSIGVDGVRHDIERGRFGRRLLMPGDETTGWIGFECAEGEAIKSVQIPIWFEPMRSPPSFLNLPISSSANL